MLADDFCSCYLSPSTALCARCFVRMILQLYWHFFPQKGLPLGILISQKNKGWPCYLAGPGHFAACLLWKRPIFCGQHSFFRFFCWLPWARSFCCWASLEFALHFFSQIVLDGCAGWLGRVLHLQSRFFCVGWLGRSFCCGLFEAHVFLDFVAYLCLPHSSTRSCWLAGLDHFAARLLWNSCALKGSPKRPYL